METVTLKARRRGSVGTRESRKVRDSGMLPAVIYGHGEAPESVALDEHDFVVAIGHGVRTMALNVEGKDTQCLIKDVQYNYLGKRPIHVDFMRVDLTEKVRVKVGIELRGVPIGVAHGGVLEHPLVVIEVECLAMAIPGTLHPVVKDLDVGQTLYVRDLVVPEGVKILNDPNEIVASVRVLAEEVVAAPTEPTAEAQVPERIGRVRPEEGAEGEAKDKEKEKEKKK